jgi:hypothetical protein
MRIRHGLSHRHAEHIKPLRVQVVAVLMGEVALQGSPVGPELRARQLIPDEHKLDPV